MKKFIGNTALKILAVVLSFIVFFTMLVSVAGSILMLFGDFYTRDLETLEKTIMKSMAKKEMFNLVSLYNDGEKTVESYYEDKNILYKIKNQHTGEVTSNFKNQDYIVEYSTDDFVSRFVNGEIGDIYYNFDEVSYNTDTGQYYFYAENNILYEIKHKAEFTIYIPNDMQFTDRFFLVDRLIIKGYQNRYITIFLAVISLTLSIFIFSYLFASVGHRNDCSEIKVAMFNNVPADILSVIVFIIYLYGIWLFTELNTLVTAVALGVIILICLYFVALWYLLSVVVQLKTKILFKHTFIYWLFKQIAKVGRVIRHIYKNLRTVYKVAMVVGVFWAFELIFMGVNAYENDSLIIGWIIISIIASAILLICAISFQRVKQGGEKIVNGDLNNKINTEYMFGDIKDFADSLNNINQGLQKAIDDKMKSERFKTELITNVSHDIKTPLTSIVNYVDLIKKEECSNEKIKEYIDVLDRQANRLKKLTEDLVEASKASSGTLSVEFTKCNLALLINQALGEFYEKFDTKGLQVVQTIDDQEVFVMADGRRLWRVFDNLLNNIYKYAMSGTRVYLDLKIHNGMAIITFRNISEQPIDVSDEELTERFVRGDRSRNTDGSGLGLSIAKSLTELQNGTFEISTDGDLFKVKITFDIIK